MSSCAISVVEIAPHLTLSNDVPTQIEAASIRDVIANEESLVRKMKEETKAAKARIRQYQAALSPCRRLPPDILGEIFLHMPPTVRYDKLKMRQGTLKTLVLVCKKWRDAAIAVPRLWSTLEIVLKKHKRHVVLEGLAAWLERAGSVPRDLVIRSLTCEVRRSVDGEGWGRERKFRPCFNGNALCVLAKPDLAEALCKMAGRCNSIELNCDTSACAQNFERLLCSFQQSLDFDMAGSAWSSTKAFSIVGRSWEAWPTSPRFLSHLMPASVITLKLRLSHTFCDIEIEDLPVKLQIPPARLEDLTSLELRSNIGARHLFPLLHGCRNLETLIIDFQSACFYDDYNDPDVRRIVESGIVLPKLRTLDIRNAVMTAGLEVLRMPGLVELSVAYDGEAFGEVYHNDREGWDMFATLVRGHATSNSTLRSLTLEGGTYGNDTLYNTLSSLTALRHLTLDDACYPKDMFSKLSAPVPCLLELRILKLLNLYEDVEKIQHLTEFVEDRGIELETSCNDEHWQES